MPPHPLTNFKIKKYYQNKHSLTVFIQEIIYLKQRMVHTELILMSINQ